MIMCKFPFFLFLLMAMCASGISAYAARNFQHSLTQQNMQTVLNSIEERLRSLDKAYDFQQANAFEQAAQRLEARFDKLEGNLSLQHFKDDIARDQILRKIDNVYERVNHKMFQIELKINSGERRIMEKLETLLLRFDRMEDALKMRKTDIEDGVTDVLVAIDELKTNVNADVENATKSLAGKIDTEMTKVGQMMRAINESQSSAPPREHFLRAEMLESIVNATRYEQQNAMRNLMVQVGRLAGKNNIADSNDGAGGQQLTNIERKIDEKFDKLMDQHALFLDSCHRIQSDEPQLESKIGEILEKIIDVFEKESAIEIKDIQHIEQLIKDHDATVRRSLYTTSHNMAVLLQKGKEHHDEIFRRVAAVNESTERIAKMLQTFSDASDGRNGGSVNGSQVQLVLDEVRNVIRRQFSENAEGSIDKNNIKIIRDEVRNVSVKVDAFLRTFGEQLSALANCSRQPAKSEDDVDLDAAIREVFGTNANATATANGNDGIVFQEINCTSGLLDVRMPNNNCTDSTTGDVQLQTQIDYASNASIAITTSCNSTDCDDDGIKLPDGELTFDLRTSTDDTNVTNQALDERLNDS